uniref:Rap guanine nucleotide exchange factor (GEF)-like 1 n=1 Tax=Sinocyclocheilus rhinocerous TaxID=307959 RepID=A0A673K327_9TELE
MKPLEKFLKKQTNALTRAGGFGEKATGTGASRRRASLSRVVPFFRETSPESGPAREVFSPETEEAPCWPSATADIRSPSLSSDEQSSEASLDTNWTPLPADTPDNLALALLDSVAGKRYANCTGETSPFSHVHAPLTDFLGGSLKINSFGEGWPGWDGAERKLAVLTVAFRYLDTYRDLLQEEGDRSNTFPKVLHLFIKKKRKKLPDLFSLLSDRAEEDKESRKKQVRPLFRHFRRIDACLQPREAFRGSDEIFCRVYTPDHSYVTIRSRLSCRVREILALVKEKLQYSEDQPFQPANLILVAVTSSGEKAVFRPSDEAVFTTLGVNTHLFACEPAELESLIPLPEEIHWSPGDSKLHDMSAEEVANQLVVFDWELFSCVHEVEFVCYVFHGEQARWRPLNLELILQRCSEVQHWVATEILQCQSLPKRIQLLRKFIKIAALCKQQQDLLSFLALVLGLDNPAVSRLRLTWEVSASVYLTFLHESCKTFHGELVNFEKMVTIEAEPSPSHLQTKAYVRQLQVIDNQNLLFEMSSKLEPKDM